MNESWVGILKQDQRRRSNGIPTWIASPNKTAKEQSYSGGLCLFGNSWISIFWKLCPNFNMYWSPIRIFQLGMLGIYRRLTLRLTCPHSWALQMKVSFQTHTSSQHYDCHELLVSVSGNRKNKVATNPIASSEVNHFVILSFSSVSSSCKVEHVNSGHLKWFEMSTFGDYRGGHFQVPCQPLGRVSQWPRSFLLEFQMPWQRFKIDKGQSCLYM